MPAVYCIDYFAKEIAAEQSGQSDSTFYTDTYGFEGKDGESKWICPNLTDYTITDGTSFHVEVWDCEDGKDWDPHFDPDVSCIDY